MCACVCPDKFVYKKMPSRKGLLYLIFKSCVDLGVKLCPIAFGASVMHSNEWTGLNLNILKYQYISI